MRCFHGAALDPNDRSGNASAFRAFNSWPRTIPVSSATIIAVRMDWWSG